MLYFNDQLFIIFYVLTICPNRSLKKRVNVSLHLNGKRLKQSHTLALNWPLYFFNIWIKEELNEHCESVLTSESLSLQLCLPSAESDQINRALHKSGELNSFYPSFIVSTSHFALLPSFSFCFSWKTTPLLLLSLRHQCHLHLYSINVDFWLYWI